MCSGAGCGAHRGRESYNPSLALTVPQLALPAGPTARRGFSSSCLHAVELQKPLPFGFVSSCKTATTSTFLIFLLPPDPLEHLSIPLKAAHGAPLPPPCHCHSQLPPTPCMAKPTALSYIPCPPWLTSRQAESQPVWQAPGSPRHACPTSLPTQTG